MPRCPWSRSRHLGVPGSAGGRGWLEPQAPAASSAPAPPLSTEEPGCSGCWALCWAESQLGVVWGLISVGGVGGYCAGPSTIRPNHLRRAWEAGSVPCTHPGQAGTLSAALGHSQVYAPAPGPPNPTPESHVEQGQRPTEGGGPGQVGKERWFEMASVTSMTFNLEAKCLSHLVPSQLPVCSQPRTAELMGL